MVVTGSEKWEDVCMAHTQEVSSMAATGCAPHHQNPCPACAYDRPADRMAGQAGIGDMRVLDSMITWLDSQRLPAWNGKHWRTAYDAGAVTDAEVIDAWLAS